MDIPDFVSTSNGLDDFTTLMTSGMDFFTLATGFSTRRAAKECSLYPSSLGTLKVKAASLAAEVFCTLPSTLHVIPSTVSNSWFGVLLTKVRLSPASTSTFFHVDLSEETTSSGKTLSNTVPSDFFTVKAGLGFA